MTIFTKTISCIVLSACALPAAAQVKTTTAATPLNQAVERAVTAAQQTPCTCVQAPLSTRELIEAEEELEQLRSVRDSNATFEKYPYLLDPAYRRQNTACACKAPATQAHLRPQVDGLTYQELIDAEEELASIRNTWDMHATFEKYPYLLDPTYRRADEETKQSIRRPYTQLVWARKVGI